MSANTIRKAKKLVENEGVAKIDDELYQVNHPLILLNPIWWKKIHVIA